MQFSDVDRSHFRYLINFVDRFVDESSGRDGRTQGFVGHDQ